MASEFSGARSGLNRLSDCGKEIQTSKEYKLLTDLLDYEIHRQSPPSIAIGCRWQDSRARTGVTGRTPESVLPEAMAAPDGTPGAYPRWLRVQSQGGREPGRGPRIAHIRSWIGRLCRWWVRSRSTCRRSPSRSRPRRWACKCLGRDRGSQHPAARGALQPSCLSQGKPVPMRSSPICPRRS